MDLAVLLLLKTVRQVFCPAASVSALTHYKGFYLKQHPFQSTLLAFSETGTGDVRSEMHVANSCKKKIKKSNKKRLNFETKRSL